MENKLFCGNIIYNDIKYSVLWDTVTELVWVKKTGDPTFGEGSYNNYRAKSKNEALEIAPAMLESIGK